MQYIKAARPVLISLAILAALPLQASAAPRRHARHARAGATLRFAGPNEYRRVASRHHHSGFVTLSGDRASGLGFYPPVGRAYAYRYGRPPGYDPTKEAMREALINQQPYGFYGTGGVPGERHAHNMFNPVDGYGSPFFAGYYGPAGDPDEEKGLFGTPYRD